VNAIAKWNWFDISGVRLAIAMLLGATVIAGPSTASAAENPVAPTGAGTTNRAYRLEGGLPLSVAMGRGAWLFGGVEFGARFAENVSLMAFFEASLAHDPMEADCSNVYCAASEYKLGARARVHFLPHFVVDPWFGCAMAARIDVGTSTNKSALDVEASLGTDVRIADVAIGPFGFLNLPLVPTNWPSGWKEQVGLGIRVSTVF
jgi:hypothetical protein